MAAQLGKPAINDARGNSLRDLQQIVGNIRERFRVVDAAVVALQTSTSGVTATTASDLTALKKRVTNLEQALVALQAEVDAIELTGGPSETDPRVEQIAGELLAMQSLLADLQASAPTDPRVEQLAAQLGEAMATIRDAERLPQVEAALSTLQHQVDDIDPVGQTAIHSAMLHTLQDQIDSINRSVLL